MQALFFTGRYADDMAKTASHLKALREAAGLSQRELARQIGQDQSNVRYWEQSGNLPRSDVLLPMAKALGVTVHELLGEARPKGVMAPGGKLGLVFQDALRLPRRQQAKLAEFVKVFIAQHANGSS
jgi:HTH-type transcriptional regulator, cell division transcriptional repressor